MKYGVLLCVLAAVGLVLAACGGGSSAGAGPGGDTSAVSDVTAPGADVPAGPDVPERPDSKPTPDVPGGPDSGADPDGGAACTSECEEDEVVCDGAGRRTCADPDDDGCFTWGAVVPCPAGDGCEGGVCVRRCADEPCTVLGARRCGEGNQVLTCGDADGDNCLDWSVAETCAAGLVCAGGYCATSCTDDCTAVGARQCDGDAVVTCGDHDGDSCLEWGDPQDCGVLVCSGGYCAETCADECTTVGATVCDGNGVKTCGNTDGDSCLEWGTVVPCAAGWVCSAGACYHDCVDECTAAGAVRCVGNAVSTCDDYDDDGCLTWGTPVACEGGLVCALGVCAAQCADECTVSGATRCNEGGQVETCGDFDENGCREWGSAVSCTGELVCSGGRCVTTCSDDCPTDGARRCVVGSTTQYAVCGDPDEDGCLGWGSAQSCGAGLVCAGGACVAACESECEPAGAERCASASATEACGDYNGDGCLEWGTPVGCDPAEECLDGACEPRVAPPIVINEVRYDGVGSDEDSFVELRGPAGTALDGFTIAGRNGNGGTRYNPVPLSGAIGASGLFLVAQPTAPVEVLDLADLLSDDIDYQNGPDSVVLEFGGVVVDAVGYGTFGAADVFAGEGSPAPDPAAGSSIGRDLLGSDTDDNAVDFHVFDAPTPGLENAAPNRLPVAALACPEPGYVDETFLFDAGASHDDDGAIVGYTFDFGDGETATGTTASASHVYERAGSFTASVTVEDDEGGAATAACTVAVSEPENLPPVAALACPAEAEAGVAASFDASGSTDPEGAPLTFTFRFGDDSAPVSGAADIVAHTYAEAGTYTVELDVSDPAGGLDTAVCTLTVAPSGAAPDLTVTTTIELCGEQSFGRLRIEGGGAVTCATGDLTIRAREVFIDPMSRIDLSATSALSSGASYRYCDVDWCYADFGRVGGGGGGYGTTGAASHSNDYSYRGEQYGSCDCRVCTGAAGGGVRDSAFNTIVSPGGAGGPGCVEVSTYGSPACRGALPGGRGGGVVRLYAAERIEVQGAVRVDGEQALTTTHYDQAGPGGGSGGGLLLVAPEIRISGTLSAAGGAGSPGDNEYQEYCYSGPTDTTGGAGGAGRIKIACGDVYVNTGMIEGATAVVSYLPPVDVTSPTHPDPALHYNDTFAELRAEWTAPTATAQGYWYLLNRTRDTQLTPTNGTYTAGTAITLPASAFDRPGAWYLHVVTVDPSAVTGTLASVFPVNINGAPPRLTSSSHPSPDAWYDGTAIALAWEPPAGVAAASFARYWYRLDRVSDVPPGRTAEGWRSTTNTQVILSSDADGDPVNGWTYHVHVAAEDTQGNLTRTAATLRVQVGVGPVRRNFYGNVRDAGGAGLAGAQVRLEPYGHTATTDANGYYFFESIYEGTYAATVTLAGHDPATLTVRVGTDAVPFEIRL